MRKRLGEGAEGALAQPSITLSLAQAGEGDAACEVALEQEKEQQDRDAVEHGAGQDHRVNSWVIMNTPKAPAIPGTIRCL